MRRLRFPHALQLDLLLVVQRLHLPRRVVLVVRRLQPGRLQLVLRRLVQPLHLRLLGPVRRLQQLLAAGGGRLLRGLVQQLHVRRRVHRPLRRLHGVREVVGPTGDDP